MTTKRGIHQAESSITLVPIGLGSNPGCMPHVHLLVGIKKYSKVEGFSFKPVAGLEAGLDTPG